MRESAPRGPEPRPTLVVLGLMALAFGLRLYAALHLSPHTDEAASQLASLRVVATGFPVFTSGVLYLQGCTMSYLMAPLAILGWDDAWDLSVLRLVTVVASTFGIPLLFQFVRDLTGRTSAATLAAFMLAVDPLTLQWGANIRPYGLLETMCIALAVLFHRALVKQDKFAAIGLIFTFALVTFTHLGGLMLWPGMVVLTLAVYRKRVFHEGLVPTLGLAGSLGGPALFLAVNTWFGVSSSKSTEVPAFVGNHLINYRRLIAPCLDGLIKLYGDLPGMLVVPPLFLTVAVGLLISWLLHIRRERRVDADLGALIALYAMPLLTVAFLLSDQQPRYLLPMQPFAIAMLAYALDASVGAGRWIRIGTQLVGSVVLGMLIWGAFYRLYDPLVDEDFRPSLDYVEAHRMPGEPVYAVIPPVFGLMLKDQTEVAFIAGPTWRRDRYTRKNEHGELSDYWIGWPVLRNLEDLCIALRDNPGAWIPMDRERLFDSPILGFMGRDVLIYGTQTVYDHPGDSLVLRPMPIAKWGQAARNACAKTIAAVEHPPTVDDFPIDLARDVCAEADR